MDFVQGAGENFGDQKSLLSYPGFLKLAKSILENYCEYLGLHS
jgi:hypothetical protein